MSHMYQHEKGRRMWRLQANKCGLCPPWQYASGVGRCWGGGDSNEPATAEGVSPTCSGATWFDWISRAVWKHLKPVIFQSAFHPPKSRNKRIAGVELNTATYIWNLHKLGTFLRNSPIERASQILGIYNFWRSTTTSLEPCTSNIKTSDRKKRMTSCVQWMAFIICHWCWFSRSHWCYCAGVDLHGFHGLAANPRLSSRFESSIKRETCGYKSFWICI